MINAWCWGHVAPPPKLPHLDPPPPTNPPRHPPPRKPLPNPSPSSLPEPPPPYPEAGASTGTSQDRVRETGAANMQVVPPPPPPGAHQRVKKGPGAAKPCDPTCLAAPTRAPTIHTNARAHTHRHGGISLPRVPPRGTGAVSSPVGLVTGQPGVVRPNHAAQVRMRAGGMAVRGRPSPNPTQTPPRGGLRPRLVGGQLVSKLMDQGVGPPMLKRLDPETVFAVILMASAPCFPSTYAPPPCCPAPPQPAFL